MLDEQISRTSETGSSRRDTGDSLRRPVVAAATPVIRGRGNGHRLVVPAPEPADTEPAALTLADTGYDDAARESRPTEFYVTATIALALCAAAPAVIVDMVATNLQSITAVFHTAQTSWVLTSGTILAALVMLLAGKLGDIHGKKKVLLVQLGVIILGCLICAATTNFSLLLVGAALTGVVSSLQVSYYGIIRDTFPRRWVPMTIAVLVAAFMVGVGLSIWVGGYLTQHHSYHAMYWALTGYMAVTLLLTIFLVPESPLRTRERVDWNSLGIIGAALFMMVYGINEASVPGRGWSSGWTLGFLLGGLALVGAWGLYERQTAQATLGINLIATRSVNSVLGVTFLSAVMLYLIASAAPTLGMTPLHFAAGTNPDGTAKTASAGYGLGLSVAQYGRGALVAAIPGCVFAILCGMWARHRGARLLLAVGPLIFAVAMLYLSTVTTQPVHLVVADSIAQAGIAAVLLAYPLLIIEAVPAHVGGVGLGFATIFQGIGDSIGSQLFASVGAANVFLANPFTGDSVITRDGMRLVFFIGAGLGVAAFLSAFLVPHGRTRSSGGALPAASELVGATPTSGRITGVSRVVEAQRRR